MNEQEPKRQKYADSGISDKAFKNMIVYGTLYVGGFLLLLVLAINGYLF